MTVKDSKTRFSSRVENYVKYRPHYPTAVLSCLREKSRLAPEKVVADIGSGTGISSLPFLRNGNRVYGVEPNKEMREASERVLSDYENFTAVNGTAEATTLAVNSVDFAVAGQAFHWFDAAAARQEFQRILKQRGTAVLVWNQRHYEQHPFMLDYETLLKGNAASYDNVKQVNSYPKIDAFFGRSMTVHEFPNEQIFDFDGLRGRFLSSSYSPLPHDASYPEAMKNLKKLFDQYAENGQVRFIYITRLFFGPLT